MHVLILPGWYPGRFTPLNGNFIAEQAMQLQAGGIQVGVLAADLDYRYWRDVGRWRQVMTVEETPVPQVRMAGFGWPKRNRRLLERWAGRFVPMMEAYLQKFGKPDILHAHVLWGGYAAMKLSRRYDIPFVLTERWSGWLTGEAEAWKKKVYSAILDACAKPMAVSKALSDSLISEFGVETEVLPNGVDTDIFTLKTMKERQPAEPFQFLAVGDLVPVKSFHLAIEALSRLVSSGENAALTFVGEGPLRKSLERQAKEWKVEGMVRFTGALPLEGVADAMREAGALLVTSEYETFGNVIIEALASGVPVIATDCGGPREFFDSGFVVPVAVNDVEELAGAMRALMKNYSKWSAQAMRNYVLEKYDKKVVAKQLESIYSEVIQSGVNP